MVAGKAFLRIYPAAEPGFAKFTSTVEAALRSLQNDGNHQHSLHSLSAYQTVA
jgi:hypothetical protein